MKIAHSTNRAFTLTEVLLSVATIAILATISIPVFQSFQNRNNLHLASSAIVSAARRAHILAQSMASDSKWGISIQSGGVILFQGASYASRVSSFDEVTEIPTSFTFSGTQEFVFNKFTGDPVTPGSVTITSPNNESATITIDSRGTVSY